MGASLAFTSAQAGKLFLVGLGDDGLELELQFERELSEGDIPIVVVEEAEDILAATRLNARDHDPDQ